MQLRNKTVSVIGGSGFIGRALVEKLARAGARVTVLTRNTVRSKNLKPLGDVGQITVIGGDALVNDDLTLAIQSADYVVNLIGIFHPSGKQNFENAQAQLPQNIATVAQKTGIKKIIHLSAIGADLNSSSNYLRTKAEGERGLLSVAPSSTILRPSIVFGPGDGFFDRFAKMAMIAPALPLLGGGTTKFQPVFVGDVADSILYCLTHQQTDGQNYELGGPSIYSFKELLAYTLSSIGKKRGLIPVPIFAMQLPAALASILPNPPITRDQLRMLSSDNIVNEKMPDITSFGIIPQPIEAHVPNYLSCYRQGGIFASS
ncbi:complex I NDUFA9 subunit family protein [Alphaproteobacteria bacterium]|nr:complex I NDUFA9 subunit family protein [Alphaproteobacteria bacterium]